MEGLVTVREGRSLEVTPTWSVASVTTVMVFVCLFAQRSIYRFGRWLKKTRRKALYSSLEKIKEELMILGLISLLLGQWARWISQICVNSSLFSSKFYLCDEKDYESSKRVLFEESGTSPNQTDIPSGLIFSTALHQCGANREPFVSYEGLEQLHRFLFVLGITHVLYSCITVALAMHKIYSWRKWENQATVAPEGSLQVSKNKVMRRQSTFALHHASHPWSRSRVLIWMFCFLKQFRRTIQKSDYLALRLGFITNHSLPLSYNFHKYMVRSMEDEFSGIVGISWPLWGYAIVCIFINIHGLDIYFWLSFIPAILVMLVGTKLQHVVSLLALEIAEAKGPTIANQVKPRDELFWFGKPEILLRLIQFISFQNAFEMATFIWSLWAFKQRCFMNNHAMIAIRLISGIVVQFWCSYSTVPLNVIITQMGSRHKKALIAESVRDSLHSWCKRVKEKSKRNAVLSVTTRSTIDERDEIITVGSGTLSRCSSSSSMRNRAANEDTINTLPDCIVGIDRNPDEFDISSRISEYLAQTIATAPEEEEEDNADHLEEEEQEQEEHGTLHPETHSDEFQKP
ncbi:OLC1v1002370C1 [Oldenlandia corymbosa var. corymbosa]|uniref:MLO-like protein n=1 Tax=Oldenlandia corymbosa var. corymbosa TaxID=529605 RepID=A0AAV1D845_OLDCO|nr:OLC1v1002370C1 [Oldenlandia corymbosa var. corymbosa]